MSLKLTNRRGATAVEYIVMIVLTAMIILAVTRIFGSTIEQKYMEANDELSGTLAGDSDRSDGSGGSGDGSSRGKSSSSGAGDGSAGGGKGGGSGDGSGGGSGGSAGKGAGGGVNDVAANGGGGGAKGGGRSVSGDGSRGADDGSSYVGEGGKPKEAKDGPGFNPIILLAALGLLGLLFFVMSKGKDG